MRRLIERYRLPESLVKYSHSTDRSQPQGFFTFGRDIVCFGPCCAGKLAPSVNDGLCDVRDRVQFQDGILHLPFDSDQIVDNLLLEKYQPYGTQSFTRYALTSAYYGIRPLLPVSLRKRLQRHHLKGWEQIPFPRWPVDITVERFLEMCLALLMEAHGLQEIPFIWFWPDTYTSCAIITHDVESEGGRDFCASLMDINDSFGIKSSYAIIPESRYAVPATFLAGLRNRGCEINVHDLNHDGRLFQNESTFTQRVAAINAYAQQFGAVGFRSGALYRNQQWYECLDFQYDMSVPNVAHLEAQRGGCCTVLPYFVGKVLELPLTVTQDYALFHLLNEYSTDLWNRQIELIRQKHGLISILVHPDYVMETRPQEVYRELLHHIRMLRDRHNVWSALPSEVNAWWRLRNGLRLVRNGSQWSIQGSGSERASVAYARIEGDTIRYEVPSSPSKAHDSSARNGHG